MSMPLASTTSSQRSSESTSVRTPTSAEAGDTANMNEKTSTSPGSEELQSTAAVEHAPVTVAEAPASKDGADATALRKPKVQKTINAKTKKTKKRSKRRSSSPNDTVTPCSNFSSSSSSSSGSSSSESEDGTSSPEDESPRNKGVGRKKQAKSRRGTKAKSKVADTDSDSNDESSSSDDEGDKKTAKARRARELRKLKARIKALETEDNSVSDSDSESSEDKSVKKSRSKKKRKTSKRKKDVVQDLSQDASYDPTQNPNHRRGLSRRGTGIENLPKLSPKQLKKEEKAAKKAEAKRKKLKGTKLEFVRVDRLWDYDKHAYITRQTRADTESGEYDEYVFNVRRIFNWDNKHVSTVVDIKSKPLKEALIKVMGVVKGISLAEDTPSIDPNMIFLYLEELRSYMNELKAKARAEKKRKRKIAKEVTIKYKAIKVLVKYLDKDYDETKKTLYPMLKSGTITFDLLWALFKSNEIVYAPTYNTEEVPRAFKVDYANLQKSLVKGEFYLVEGKYLDYNGTVFGKGDCDFTVEHFKGPRKISSLSCFPIKYHRDYTALREKLISRGRDFVALKGMLYKLQKGMAFYKKPNGQVVKVNVDGRVMIDPANFRRINPNYNVSTIKSEDPDLLSDDDCCSEEEEEREQRSDDETDENQFDQFETRRKDTQKMRKKLVKDSDDEIYVVEIHEEHNSNEIKRIDGNDEVNPENFKDEEYLIASPVVLGFSFGHKMWMEFDIAGLSEIQWNEGAFDSLVIPHDQKDVVKALVESHSYSASKNIDDVIQGKGQGLVAVLHGPPGTGKTLTAEGIAELLKKPLYMVSVGELGIKGGDLEKNFSQIIDIAHCWGALLLLDEADVFLEKRELHDISRNALVSIFLRLLEYFHGILFLTTNRVVTFDEAFASRIHIGLRYGELSLKAKKNVWRLFIDKVRKLGDGIEVDEFSEEQYAKLSQYQLNGREIKNSVRTAQSLATIEKKSLSMEHLLKVLFVGNVFAKDLKGPGYEEALKFYM